MRLGDGRALERQVRVHATDYQPFTTADACVRGQAQLVAPWHVHGQAEWEGPRREAGSRGARSVSARVPVETSTGLINDQASSRALFVACMASGILQYAAVMHMGCESSNPSPLRTA